MKLNKYLSMSNQNLANKSQLMILVNSHNGHCVKPKMLINLL